ncbi:hypothetical protein [Halobacillus litoralis]|nr:hypothetical protein [Halobacillus litoralis]
MAESIESYIDMQDKEQAINEIMESYGQSILQSLFRWMDGKLRR